MKTKNVAYLITLVTFLFITIGASYAQDEKEVEKPMMKMHKMMSDSTMMEGCMDKISSDDGMRMMMMDKMMKSSEGDDKAMMEMCKTMMNNPEMHSMMMKIMGGDMMKDGKMMHDGMMKDKSNSNDEGGNNSEHESHHKNNSDGND